jgi:hypothetical protein
METKLDQKPTLGANEGQERKKGVQGPPLEGATTLIRPRTVLQWRVPLARCELKLDPKGRSLARKRGPVI